MPTCFARVLKRHLWNFLSIRGVRQPNVTSVLTLGLINLNHNSNSQSSECLHLDALANGFPELRGEPLNDPGVREGGQGLEGNTLKRGSDEGSTPSLVGSVP